MLKIQRTLTLFAFLGLAALARPAVAAEKGEPVQLFNGKDLTGWTGHFNDGGKIEEIWTVKEGGILHNAGKPVGYIRTEKDYTNYVLTLEWRFPGKPGNGGVLLRQVGEDKVWPKSIEAQLQHNNAGDFWNIDQFQMTVDPERTKGRNTKKLHESNEKPLGEWNQYEITVDGGRVELKVNGLVQNVATDCAVVPGKICLQSEGSEMEFRNIVLTPLPDRGGEGASASTGTNAKTIKLLEGGDLSQFASYSEKQGTKTEAVWQLKDGVLHCTGTPTGFLETNEQFKDYTLRFDWRWPGQAGNSGVLLRTQDPDGIWPKCLEAQLQHGQAGLPIPLGGYKAKVTQTPKASAEKPAGEWNTYEITMKGDRSEMKVNGQLLGVAEDCEDVAGTIGFQSEGAPIEFRNIEVTKLDAAGGVAEVAAVAGTADSDVVTGTDGTKRLPGLDGWHVLGNGNWTYRDGVIEGKQGKAEKSYTHVVSDKAYKNFKASVKFKAVAGNSGFYFRVQPDEQGRMHGIQAEIDEKNNVGGMYESYGRNWLSQPKKEDVEQYFKPQEWNEMTVEGHGPHVVVHVNGVKSAEINDPTIRMEGPFALQIHGGQDVHVMFKDIRIEELK